MAAGWLIAKTDFFDKIRTKLIPKLFNNLYSNKRNKPIHKLMGTHQIRSVSNPFSNVDFNASTVEQMFKHLKQHLFRIDCLTQKKSKTYSRLSKQITQYNKTHQTNIKV
jgi:hypothetical protein